jgi:flagellin
MSGINTNVASLFAQNNLSKSSKELGTAIQRLSSGLRVNSARDDAAGLAISEKFRSQIGGQEVAKRNANDGISALEVGEGALGQITDSLQRMRELAVQASTGTLTADDRSLLTEEYNTLKSNVDSIIKSTQFNGIDLLTSGAGDLDVQVGQGNGATDSLKISLGDIEGNFNAFTTSTTTGAFSAPTSNALTLGNITATGAGIVDGLDAAGAAGTSATYDLDGDGVADLRGTSDGTNITTVQFLDKKGNAVGDAITVGAARTSISAITLGDLGLENKAAANGPASVTLGAVSVSLASDNTNFTGGTYLSGANIDGADGVNARAAIGKLDTFINDVSTQRAKLGAGINRLESVISNLDTSTTAISTARGRIIDADFAKETANLTRAQILQQAGTSVLAQANQLPSSVLSLLG